MVQIVEMNDQEKFEMYDKLSKKEVIQMLIQSNKMLDSIKPNYVPLQTCPICSGKGVIKNPIDCTAVHRTCDYCNGRLVIPMQIIR